MDQLKKVIAIIPSRYGSTRLQGKPLALIAGRPMIEHVYQRAMRAGCVSDVYVATDDERIYRATETFGGKAVMTSEKARSGTDRVAEAAAILDLAGEDIVVNVQGDQPLLDPRCIEELVDPLFTSSEVKMTTLAFRIVNEREITDPKDVKVTFNANGVALYFSRSTIPYDRDCTKNIDVFKHLGLYAYTRNFLETFCRLPSGRLEQIEKLEQLRALEHGYPIQVVVTAYDSPEVDLPEDIVRIEQLIQ